uniref:Tho2 domain-containing protein n=1 Tax=Heterorhabditis bacteriophora TaxID=37862 RepID=A0A1I7X8W3_HETBA
MSSIESVAGATQDQLEALSGGELLRQEAGGFSNARNKRASARLRDALLSGDMAVGLCILIAQQRECVIHNDSKLLPLKLVGEMTDQVNIASILMSEFHLRLDSAMYLTRPTYMPKVQSAYESAKRAVKSLDGEHKQKLDSKQKFVFFKSALDTVVNQLIDELTPCMPTHVCSDIPMRLLVVFWILSLYDIDVPTAAYERTVEAIRKQAKDNSERIDMVWFFIIFYSKSKRLKEEERLRNVETKLKEEQKRQSDHVERIRLWLAHSKDRLFEAGRSQQTGSFLQMCIIPRALFSESDAIYCARLVIILHQQRTTLFQSLIFIDKTFSDVLPLICGLSENEANSFGRFLQIILSQTQRWHADKNIFEKECEGFPGLITKMRSGGAVEDSGDNVSFENFRKLCYKWQAKLNKAFLSLIPCFPLLREFYESLEQVVVKVRDGEKGSRDDLSLKAASYAGRLKIRGLPLFEAHQFCHRPTTMKISKTNGDATDRKRFPQAASPSGAKRKVKTEKMLEKKDAVKQDREKRDKVDKEDKVDNAEREEKMLEPEEGEVPPSPPSKKIRAYSTDDRNRTNGVSKDVKDEKDRKDKPKKEAKRELEKDGGSRESKEKDDRRRKEISLDHDVAGPMPPPSKKDDRAQERKRETKGHKRQARDGDENGYISFSKYFLTFIMRNIF